MVKVLSRDAVQRMTGRRSSSAVNIGGGSGDASGVSRAWVEENYISKNFFNQLFTIHGTRTYTDEDTQEEVTEDVVITPNTIADGEEYKLSNVEVSIGLWTQQFLSALGLNPGGGGGGGSYTLAGLDDVQLGTLANGQALVYDSASSKWVNGTVIPDLTDYAKKSWVQQQGYITSSALNGYATQSWVNQQGYLTSSAISDMATKTWVGQQGYLTSSAISDMATKTWVNNQGFLTSSAISDMATKTWVNQQGFLTQHQTVSGTFWGQAWSNGGTVKGSLSAGSNGGVIEQFHCIELNNAGSLSGYGGYIDFHYNGSAADYTTRLIESEAGVLLIQGKNSASPYSDKVVGLKVGSNVTGASYVQIGNVKLVYDSTNNALKVEKSDGTAANFYATGGVSALGYSPGGGGGGATALTDLVDVAISNPTNGQVLMYNSSTGKWYNGNVQSGGGGTVTSITAGTGLTGGTITASGTIALSQETQTAIANGVTAYGWGDHSQAGYLTSSALTGYATQQWVQQQGYITSSALNGYATQSWVQQQGYLTQHQSLVGYATESWVNNKGYATQSWVQQQGYLTSHQSVDGTFWGQSWTNHGSVSGNINAGSNGGQITGFHCIELNNAGSLSGYGGYIDFHYNGSAADYTSRIIEDASGRLFFDTSAGVRIGNAQLSWDNTNNALKIQKIDGTAANLYATGGVSALGMSAGVSQMDAMTFNHLSVKNSLTLSGSVNIVTGTTSYMVRNAYGSDCIYLMNYYTQSKINSRQYYYNQYDNVGLHGTNYDYSETWYIDPDGCARFSRVYLSNNTYIYTNGSDLLLTIGSTTYKLTKTTA